MEEKNEVKEHERVSEEELAQEAEVYEEQVPGAMPQDVMPQEALLQEAVAQEDLPQDGMPQEAMPQRALPSKTRRLILYLLSAFCASNVVLAFSTEAGFDLSVTTVFAAVFSALASWACWQRARGLPILPFLFKK